MEDIGGRKGVKGEAMFDSLNTPSFCLILHHSLLHILSLSSEELGDSESN